LAVAICLARPALAATPFVEDSWRYGAPAGAAELRYCVDARDPDFAVAQRIATALAGRLLVRPSPAVVAAETSGDDIAALYRLLLRDCDVYFGFKLLSDAYPPWLAITRPYYRAAYVYAVAPPGWRSLADMPVARPIAATMGTAGDLRLTQYLLALSAGRRWDKFPMATDEAALRAVLGGTAGAALVWAPALWALRRGDAAFDALVDMAPAPLPVTTVAVGAVMLSRRSFLRSSLDNAIASLAADGSLAALFAATQFPAVMP